MKKKIAVIGMGGIAQKGHLPVLTAMPGLELFFHSRTADKVKELADLYRVPKWTTSLDELFSWKPDCAFILTPTPSHYQLASACLEAGMDIFTEKPATESAAETRKLAELADAKKRIAMVAFNRRYALLYRKAKEIFADQPIRFALFQKHRPQSPHVNLFNQYLDDTIHQIDLMRYYGGDLEALSTHYASRDNHLTNAVSVARTAQGGLVTLVNDLQAGAWQESVTLHGDGMTVHVDAFRELRIRYGDREEVYGTDRAGKWIPGLRERGFEGEILHFLECVQTHQRPMTDAWEAAKTQKFMEDLVVASGDPLSSPDNSWDKVDRWGDS